MMFVCEKRKTPSKIRHLALGEVKIVSNAGYELDPKSRIFTLALVMLSLRTLLIQGIPKTPRRDRQRSYPDAGGIMNGADHGR
jgi:hypothetical protein